MSYKLGPAAQHEDRKISVLTSLKHLLHILADERKVLLGALLAMLLNSLLMLLGPYLIGYTIDHHIRNLHVRGLLVYSGILLGMYCLALVSGYMQTKLMGGIGQRVLFQLRNSIFSKLQELPVAFFHTNKAGDLISRINNDTEKIQIFFAQSLLQFLSSIFIMTGAAIFLFSINLPLGAAALSPALIMLVFTRFISPFVKAKNAAVLASTGQMSAEIQESLSYFKVVIAGNRRQFFIDTFGRINLDNFSKSYKAGVANNIFVPFYGFFASMGQLIVLALGIYMVSKGSFTIGMLISFLSYITSFYNPLRQLAALWSSFQVALAAWDRISVILSLKNTLGVATRSITPCGKAILGFSNVSFSYPDGDEVLHRVTFELERGRKYAFVGPTGGGKTTTASLMARLYDTSRGAVFLKGHDIRTYTPEERTAAIGFILLDPFVFTGSVKDNIVFGNQKLTSISSLALLDLFREKGLDSLLSRFPAGLDTQVNTSGESISLGQKQLIAFIRAVLREPEILILDEASANIDTITEKQLEIILKGLPAATTLVIIAHRMNTIENADEIFFVNGRAIICAGSMENALEMLMHQKLSS
jgi:ATP-binding cassette subfamily B protein